MTVTSFNYFAYGSNMLTRRLTRRASSAKRFASGYVERRRLTFDKVSQDGSGKCDAQLTKLETDRVYGVVFKVDFAEEAALDVVEGFEKGYDKEAVKVITASGEVDATTYIATKKDRALRPYRWYKALTIAGALEHGLPNDYIEWIRTVESTEDPDLKRRAENEALLFDG